jgi:hypothetical protein
MPALKPLLKSIFPQSMGTSTPSGAYGNTRDIGGSLPLQSFASRHQPDHDVYEGKWEGAGSMTQNSTSVRPASQDETEVFGLGTNGAGHNGQGGGGRWAGPPNGNGGGLSGHPGGAPDLRRIEKTVKIEVRSARRDQIDDEESFLHD